jgi:hypothetical protein
VFLAAGGAFENTEEINEYINVELIMGNAYKEYQVMWGVFLIENNSIRFEHWYPSSGGPLKAYVRSGTILNDTTFQITKSYRNKNGEKAEVTSRNEVYHFKQFSPKPDSTNKYVQ